MASNRATKPAKDSRKTTNMPIFSTFSFFFEQIEEFLCGRAIYGLSPEARMRGQEKGSDIQMTTNTHGETATIYQFPVGGRAASTRKDGKFASDMKEKVCDAASGSWYHQAAVVEAEKPRKP
jgi:hypothetical protein